jgi:hypothetical protein
MGFNTGSYGGDGAGHSHRFDNQIIRAESKKSELEACFSSYCYLISGDLSLAQLAIFRAA